MGVKAQTRGERNAEWIQRHCRVPEGKLVGQPVRLTAKQRGWLKRIYDTPTRLFVLSLGRKQAKTCFAAFLLLLHLAGPESRPNSQLYSTAQSLEQSGVLFSLAAKCVRMSPDLSQYIIVRERRKELFCGERGSLYRALSAEVATSFGLSPAFVVHDELGQVRGPRSALFEAIETASAAQAEPLSIVISTQAPSDSDLLSVLIDDALAGADPRNKVEIYSAPMDLNPFSEEAIRAANPHFDEDFVNREEVQRQASDARRMPSREASFRNLILNQRVEAKNLFVSPQVWAENAADTLGDFAGLEVYGGLDLSSVSDLTALVLTCYRAGAWDVLPTFWLPEEGLAEKSRIDRVSYDVWQREGYLKTCPGAAIQYEFVAEHLRGVFDGCKVKAIAFDRWNMKHLKPWLVKAGFTDKELEKFKDFGQGFVSMSPALRELESMLLARKFRHGNHPVLRMCFANATTLEDAAQNRKFVKKRTTGRIDGAVALAMTVGVMPGSGEPAKKYQAFWC